MNNDKCWKIFVIFFLLIFIFPKEVYSSNGIKQLPTLKPLKTKKYVRKYKKKKRNKKKIRRVNYSKEKSVDWQYQLTLSPYIEYVGGMPEQGKRVGSKASFYYNYGDLRLYMEGFFEIDKSATAETRKSKNTTALQEAFVEYRIESFILKAGTQALRWSEAWTMPSLDGWTARRFNRLFYDSLSEQLIHPTGVLLNWNTSSFVLEFFQNYQPAESIYPEPLPSTKQKWQKEWGAHTKYRFESGLDADMMYFEKVGRTLYGASVNYATDYFVPKVEIGKDSNDSNFTIFGLDFFYGKFTIIPRLSNYEVRPLIPVINNEIQKGTNYNLTIRWDDNPTWIEGQVFYDSVMESQFYSLRFGRRFGKNVEFSCFAQNYSGAENTLFGLYEKMTGSESVIGSRILLSL